MSRQPLTRPRPPVPSASRGVARGSLSHQLSLRVAALVALVAVLLSVSSTLAVRLMLVGQLDDQLSQSFVRQSRPGEDRDHPNPDQTLANPGSTIGTVVARQFPTGQRTGAIIVDGQPPAVVLLPQEAVNGLLAVAPGTTTTIEVPVDAGTSIDYRVTLRASEGGYWAVGLPMTSVQRTTASLILFQAILSVLAVGVAIVVSRAVVRTSLKPLHRLAATADEVSRLELDKGEVQLPMRVPASDTDLNTEVGRVGHAFNHMLNNVEGALASRQRSESQVRQFVADASHELRNPLAAIRGYAELTRRERDQLPETTGHAFERIEAESERMSRLVEDMLLLARLDSGPNVQLAPVDAVELVLNAVGDARVAGPGHHWQLELPEGTLMVRADQHQLHQAVANLLSNARRHTPAGTTVRTSVGVQDGWVRITVADDGPGVPDEVREHVFERFARADVSRTDSSQGSTGLGLAIVAAVMQAQGGSASMRSGPDGSQFTLWVPAQS